VIPTLVWTLPRPAKSRYKGAFPLHFEQNLVQLLGYPEQILHPFGGRAELGLRVDIEPTREPDVVADAHKLPFDDESFDCVVLDPPYSDEEARELYGTPPLRPAVYTKEAVRVLREGGWLVVYGDREPARPARCNHAMRIMVILRPHHRPRVAMVFQKRKRLDPAMYGTDRMPFYGTEVGEDSEGAEQELLGRNGAPDPLGIRSGADGDCPR
jgi:SAM-dependent methyltransferase